MYCTTCEISRGISAKFCSYCGTRLVGESRECNECGKKYHLADKADYCEKCGNRIRVAGIQLDLKESE